jgi:hypothetical protein
VEREQRLSQRPVVPRQDTPLTSQQRPL